MENNFLLFSFFYNLSFNFVCFSDSMISTIGIILLSMHREPGLNSEKIAIAGPSMYMKELQEFIYRAWNNHAVPFDDKETTCKW